MLKYLIVHLQRQHVYFTKTNKQTSKQINKYKLKELYPQTDSNDVPFSSLFCLYDNQVLCLDPLLPSYHSRFPFRIFMLKLQLLHSAFSYFDYNSKAIQAARNILRKYSKSFGCGILMTFNTQILFRLSRRLRPIKKSQ